MLDLFPVLRERLDEPAGNLSGGQQQMLALGMAFIEKPRLLMIDELSLGLAPAIVEQLLPLVRDIADQGTTIILVEQSVNLALTIAETAYFMEKGEIRFHGPTAELLERPDVLRSVFLEGATKGMTVNEQPSNIVPATVGATCRRARRERRAQRRRRAGRRRTDSARSRGVTSASAASPRCIDVSLQVAAGEIVGFIGPNGAGKTTLFDAISGFLEVDAGTIILGEGDRRGRRDALLAGRAREARPGPLVPGRPPLPEPHRARDHLGRVRTPSRRSAIRSRPRFGCRRWTTRSRTSRRTSSGSSNCWASPTSATSSARELSTGSRRIVDLACVLAHEPSVVLLDEPSSGIAQREAEALGPLLLRIGAQTGATLLVIEHDVPLLLGIADRMIALDLGEVVAVGAPGDVINDPAVVQSYLGTTEAAIARSGSRGT